MKLKITKFEQEHNVTMHMGDGEYGWHYTCNVCGEKLPSALCYLEMELYMKEHLRTHPATNSNKVIS